MFPPGPPYVGEGTRTLLLRRDVVLPTPSLGPPGHTGRASRHRRPRESSDGVVPDSSRPRERRVPSLRPWTTCRPSHSGLREIRGSFESVGITGTGHSGVWGACPGGVPVWGSRDLGSDRGASTGVRVSGVSRVHLPSLGSGPQDLFTKKVRSGLPYKNKRTISGPVYPGESSTRL